MSKIKKLVENTMDYESNIKIPEMSVMDLSAKIENEFVDFMSAKYDIDASDLLSVKVFSDLSGGVDNAYVSFGLAGVDNYTFMLKYFITNVNEVPIQISFDMLDLRKVPVSHFDMGKDIKLVANNIDTNNMEGAIDVFESIVRNKMKHIVKFGIDANEKENKENPLKEDTDSNSYEKTFNSIKLNLSDFSN